VLEQNYKFGVQAHRRYWAMDVWYKDLSRIYKL